MKDTMSLLGACGETLSPVEEYLIGKTDEKLTAMQKSSL